MSKEAGAVLFETYALVEASCKALLNSLRANHGFFMLPADASGMRPHHVRHQPTHFSRIYGANDPVDGKRPCRLLDEYKTAGYMKDVSYLTVHNLPLASVERLDLLLASAESQRPPSRSRV